ncbi:MAG TPA: IPT/TIG domain-containing protein [Acidimicrobiales bacterium]|nr:IPT/TIG domain-containing protein [Acidimicrobiales bacterium]
MRLSTSHGSTRKILQKTAAVLIGVTIVAGGLVGIAVVPAGAVVYFDVNSVTPNTGPTTGGTSVVIVGDGFDANSGSIHDGVFFGGVPATGITDINSRVIDAISPPGAVGLVDVTVEGTLGITSPNPQADGFTYFAPPTVTGVSPDNGVPAGGTSVTITGTGLSGATAVHFGVNLATGVTCSATSCTVTAPAGSAGTVDVTVTTPRGTSAANPPGDQFTYEAAPTVTAISPTAGPVAGGTAITITGTGFIGATAADIGGSNACTSAFTVVSATSITCDTPAGSAGTVDVTVTTPQGTSAANPPGDQFTYEAAPTATGVSPDTGPPSGGTSATITGTNLTGATAVDFGANLATGVSCSATSCAVTAPAGSTGTVDVTVTIPGGGTSAANPPGDQFTYEAAPTVTGVSPDTGLPAGGTAITITGTGFIGATAADIGASNACTSAFTVVSATSITCDTPVGSAGTVDVTVTTPQGTSATNHPGDQFIYVAAPAGGGGGGGGGGPPTPPAPPSGATSSQSCSSPSPSGTATCTNDGTTVSANGEGSLTVSQYGSDPVGSPAFSASGVYIDVEVASGSSFGSLTITDCNLSGATSLEWWNGSAWLAVSPESYSAGPPKCVTATLDSTSSPTIADLSGTVFAGALPATTAPGAPMSLGATPGNTTATLSWTAPSSNGGTTITGYDVYEGTTPGGESTTPVNRTTLIGATSYTVTGLTNGTTYYFDVQAVNLVGNSVASNEASATPTSTPTPTPTTGYWEVGSDGGNFAFGGSQFFGSTGAQHLNKPVVGMASTPDGQGYWLVASDGGIFTFGDAGFFGSTGAMTLNKPVVSMDFAPGGQGYWLVASDGGIFAFGNAKFFGSTGAQTLNKPIVAMVSTPDGGGYWLVASDGGVFAFGDAQFYGSTGGMTLNKPIVGMASTPDGGGYWLVASDGGIFSFGDAAFYGSTGGQTLNKPIVGMASSPDGGGYWLVASDGGIFAFGDAPFLGSTGGQTLNQPIVGMASEF